MDQHKVVTPITNIQHQTSTQHIMGTQQPTPIQPVVVQQPTSNRQMIHQQPTHSQHVLIQQPTSTEPVLLQQPTQAQSMNYKQSNPTSLQTPQQHFAPSVDIQTAPVQQMIPMEMRGDGQGSNPPQGLSFKGYREWSIGLFDCFSDIGPCIKSFLCLPFGIGTLATRTGEWACMPFCVPGGTIALRSRIRLVAGVKGSVCGDCMALGLCGPCAVYQMERELDNMQIP